MIKGEASACLGPIGKEGMERLTGKRQEGGGGGEWVDLGMHVKAHMLKDTDTNGNHHRAASLINTMTAHMNEIHTCQFLKGIRSEQHW